jgi:hypothetical protein
MNDDFSFRTPPEEVQELARELSQVRALLKEISIRLSQIERHAKRALGPLYPPKGGKRDRPFTSQGRKVTEGTVKVDEVNKIFEDLTNLWKEKGGEAVEQKLAALSVPDLNLIAHELGASRGSKPSRKSLQAAIVGRVNESIMLSQNRTAADTRSSSEPPSSDKPPSEE